MLAVDEKVLSSVFNDNLGNRNAAISGYTRNKLDMANEARRINLFVHDQMKIADMGNSAKRVLDREQYSYRNNRLRFVNNQQISLKTGHHNEVETWASHDNFPDSVDFRVNLKQMKTEASFEQERILHKTNGSYREDREKEIYKTHSREEERLISEDDPSHNSDIGSFPSSTVSDDIVFNRYLMEANAFLKEARECLREGHAETVLYESAKLLYKAIDMKPLLAVGQLGNTYLLHGELKLKISH